MGLVARLKFKTPDVPIHFRGAPSPSNANIGNFRQCSPIGHIPKRRGPYFYPRKTMSVQRRRLLFRRSPVHGGENSTCLGTFRNRPVLSRLPAMPIKENHSGNMELLGDPFAPSKIHCLLPHCKGPCQPPFPHPLRNQTLHQWQRPRAPLGASA